MKLFVRILSLSLLILLSACAAFSIGIQDAKVRPDSVGDPVTVSGKVITYKSADFFYIEEDSRAIGIRVNKTDHGLDVGMRVNVVGDMYTNSTTKERYILADSAVQSGPLDPDDAITPVAVINKDLGGADWQVVGSGGQLGVTSGTGLNNVGLLVKTWGQFTKIDETSFTLDDGSGVNILCTVPSGTFLSDSFEYVVVSGVVSMRYSEGEYKPLLLVSNVSVSTPIEAITAPGAPTGETSPLVNLPYGYTTIGSTCTQGHPIEYSFDWGDGTTSPWSTSKTAFHIWLAAGTHTVTVSARCQSNHSLTLASAGLVVTPISVLASNPWPMFRHDLRHSGLSPYHDPIPGGTAWSQNIGNGLSSPVIASDGTIFMSGGSSTLKALNSDGSIKWSQAITSATRSTPAIGADGNVYIGSTGYLYAYTTAGVFKWRRSVSGDVTSSPAVGPDGTVYVGSRGGVLYAITPGATSGTQKWALSVGDMHITSPVVSDDGTTVYTGGGSTLWAINTGGTDRVKWSYPLGVSMTSSAALSPDGSTVYIGAYDGNLYAVDAVSGTLVWKVQVGFKNAVTSASPAIGADGTIYLGSNYGSLYAINPDGSQKWIFETRSDLISDRDIRSSVAINADGTVILASYDGYVRGIDADTGVEKWRHLLPGKNYASPAIAPNGTIVAATMSGYVYGNIGGTPPAAIPPTGLIVSLASDTSAALSWTDNSSDEYGFRIERRIGTVGAYTWLTNVAAGITTYTDSGLQSGQICYYRVAAYQQAGPSAYSNEAFVITPGLMTPTGLVATPITTTQIDLTWTDMASDESGFAIERSAGPNGLFKEIARVGQNVQYYSDTNVYPATDYYYRVRAYNGGGYSSYSNEDWALTFGKSFSEIVFGDKTRPQMALTFDAGTANIRTGLLSTLKSNSVFSTFFLTGYVTEVQGTQVGQIGSDGHHIGNHSYDHPDLRYQTDEQIAWQLGTADTIIRNASGHHTQSYFRAPYGARNQHVLDAAAEVGYRHVAWSGDSGDAGGTTTQQIIDRTIAAAGNGVIMLYHCTVANTESAMPTIITNLRNMGYELVTVPELVAPLQVTSPVGQLNTGWNLISLPIDPALEFPHIVFRGLTINGNLKRWNVPTTSEITYSSTTPGPFGNIYADEGYWLNLSAPATIKFNGTAATTARRIKLPETSNPAQYALIGYPFQTSQDFSNCTVYNPNAADPKTRTILEAITLGWIPDRFLWWNSVTQTESDVSVPGYGAATTMLEPWCGYKAAALVPGVELIIPVPTP